VGHGFRLAAGLPPGVRGKQEPVRPRQSHPTINTASRFSASSKYTPSVFFSAASQLHHVFELADFLRGSLARKAKAVLVCGPRPNIRNSAMFWCV
jgi:hypothetical protein